MQLFVDMDGVLADFDAHHEAVFGVRSSKLTDNVDWAKVRAVEGFYSDIPPMPDMVQLWSCVEPMRPTILTGVPGSVPVAVENKQAWVRKNLGPNIPVICCPSRDKSLHCRPGDILIDDWTKYRLRWLTAGGTWITHTSAAESIIELHAVLCGRVR